ncbi:MAG: sulfatase-modifying factor protein, partial [Deltaproteobacteria bacterium]
MENVWTDPVTGMEFIKVPGGSFMMGDTFGDGDDDEKPVHEVRLDEFYIGKYPVTQGQWEKVMGSNPSRFQKGGDYPVEKVSWDDTQKFIKKLTQMNDGRYGFRLPSEAEWEYAARSGGRKERYAGGDDIDAVAWYDDNSDDSTHPVGRKAPNGLGIHDMSGNVWEWCGDWYGDYPSVSVKNPKSPDTGSRRVLRGGCWYYGAGFCRSANRGWYSPDGRFYFLGLRLAL